MDRLNRKCIAIHCLYCDMGAGELGRAVLQHNHCSCDTALRQAQAGRWALGERACGALRHGRGASCDTRVGRCDTACWHPRHGARLGVPVRMLGMLAGSAGPVWVLVNLAQF